jgi:hypothetical protein
MKLNKEVNYIVEIKEILQNAKQKSFSAVNTAMVEAYWLIGKRIVEEEQNGEDRAIYGKEAVKKLSIELTLVFGKGYSERSVREFRQFYQTFPDLFEVEKVTVGQNQNNIQRTTFTISVNPNWRIPFANLYWSHYQRVLRVTNKEARMYYLMEAAEQNWSISTLCVFRSIRASVFGRMGATKKMMQC